MVPCGAFYIMPIALCPSTFVGVRVVLLLKLLSKHCLWPHIILRWRFDPNNHLIYFMGPLFCWWTHLLLVILRWAGKLVRLFSSSCRPLLSNGVQVPGPVFSLIAQLNLFAFEFLLIELAVGTPVWSCGLLFQWSLQPEKARLVKFLFKISKWCMYVHTNVQNAKNRTRNGQKHSKKLF